MTALLDVLQAWLTAGRLEAGGELGQLGLVRNSQLVGEGCVEDEGDVLGQRAAAGEWNELRLEAALFERSLEKEKRENFENRHLVAGAGIALQWGTDTRKIVHQNN